MSLSYQHGPWSIGIGIADPITLAGFAQRFGSPVDNHATHQPLQDLVIDINNGIEIFPRRFFPISTYKNAVGRVIGLDGELKKVAMGDIAKKDGEATALGTIILCLSVPMTLTSVSHIVARAILFSIYGANEKVEDGCVSLLVDMVRKYANAVISRDNVFSANKHRHMQDVKEKLKRELPQIPQQFIFFPPRTVVEEADFVPFLSAIMTSRADDETIYTRSLKLLVLAMMLKRNGWVISITIEDSDGIEKRLDYIPGSLTVHFSLRTEDIPTRDYIENHSHRSKQRSRPFYQTANCTVATMMDCSSLAITEDVEHAKNFIRGYEEVKELCSQFVQLQFGFANNSIKCSMSTSYEKALKVPRDCRSFVATFAEAMPYDVQTLVVAALCKRDPNYEWDRLMDEMEKQPNMTRPLSACPLTRAAFLFKGPVRPLWTLAGAITAIFDVFVKALVNLNEDSHVRVPTQLGFVHIISSGNTFLKQLLETGVSLGKAVMFCSSMLAGVPPNDRGMAVGVNPESVIGFWSGEQGILPTTILERTLYSDLASDKVRPFTLHNTPILGMPMDEGGWIKPAPVDRPFIRMRDAQYFKTLGSPGSLAACSVIVVYRPWFESDERCVVAAIYLNGIFHCLCPLTFPLPMSNDSSPKCNHSDQQEDFSSELLVTNMCDWEPGEFPAVRENSMPGQPEPILVLKPQNNHVARFFSHLIVDDEFSIQNGCLSCTFRRVREKGHSYLIPASDKGPPGDLVW